MAKATTYKIIDKEKAEATRSAYTKAFLEPILNSEDLTCDRKTIADHVETWLKEQKSKTKITVSNVMSFQGHGCRKDGIIEIYDENGEKMEIKPRENKAKGSEDSESEAEVMEEDELGEEPEAELEDEL